MPFTESIADFFQTGDFATAATWSVGSATKNVIFDADYLEPLGNLVEGAQPVAVARAADFPAVAHGQTLTINGTVYTIRGVEPFDAGLVRLRLEEA